MFDKTKAFAEFCEILNSQEKQTIESQLRLQDKARDFLLTIHEDSYSEGFKKGLEVNNLKTDI